MVRQTRAKSAVVWIFVVPVMAIVTAMLFTGLDVWTAMTDPVALMLVAAASALWARAVLRSNRIR